jgi:hypothetical protein
MMRCDGVLEVVAVSLHPYVVLNLEYAGNRAVIYLLNSLHLTCAGSC